MKLSSPFLLALISGTKLGALLVAPMDMATPFTTPSTIETAQTPVTIEVATIEADRPGEQYAQQQRKTDHDTNHDHDLNQDYDRE